MIKHYFQLLFVILSLNASTVSAHAVVTNTSLKIDPIKAGTGSKVSLTFNSRVELALSHFDLVKKDDVHERLHVNRGKIRGEVVIDIPPLEPGEHAIRLKVFAADGHLTEDIIRFFVIE
ncbi:copper resistance CopC family protein [Methylotuvimicrobium sp. KM1]|uniref:copper resistance CopC family protein n=1 Tax=Methylotuvimicrobium sp. KM1 TaxID=3377707 RepID=UPI00384F3C43